MSAAALFRHKLRQVQADCRAVASIEFALVLPALALVWLGMIELQSLLEARNKLQASAMTFADLVSQEGDWDDDALTSTRVGQLHEAIKAILKPLPNSDDVLAVRIASVVMRKSKDPVEGWAWTCGKNVVPGDDLSKLGLEPASDSMITKSTIKMSSAKLKSMDGLAESDASMLVVQMVYSHDLPIFGFITDGNVQMTEEFIVRPRYTRRLQLDDPDTADLDELYKSSYSGPVKSCS